MTQMMGMLDWILSVLWGLVVIIRILSRQSTRFVFK